MLQPRAHKTKLQKKSTSPAKPKLTIGAHVHYRDYTINRPKWVAGKVTGHVGNKMFTVQGPDGHCRRHEDQLKLRSVPKLNRQRRLSRPLQSTVHVIQRRISSDSTTEFQNVLFISPTRSRMKNCCSRSSTCVICVTCVTSSFESCRFRYSTNQTYCRVSNEQSGREDCRVSHSMLL